MDAIISIYVDKDMANSIASKSKILYNLIHIFLTWLNSKIGSETTVEYRINPVNNLTIKYTIKKYTKEDIAKSEKDVIIERFKIITDFTENLNESIFSRDIKECIRNINSFLKFNHNISLDKIINISLIHNNKVILNRPLKIKFPKIENITYKITKLCDGSTIRQYIDPYLKNYAIYADYSKTLDEFNYMYNCLHVYEHYLTYAWKDSSNNDVLMMNGSTFTNALCYIYTVVRTKKSLIERLISTIMFHIKSSDVDFVKKTKALDVETIRTISEAYKLRNLTRSGRTDQKGYVFGYDEKLFAYWSSLPQNILILTSEEIDINVDSINEFYRKNHVNAEKPKKIKFDYFPKEIFYVHTEDNSMIFKKDINKIIDKIYSKNNNYKSMYGIGNKYICYKYNVTDFPNITDKDEEKIKTDDKIDISEHQTILHALLVFAKYTDINTIQKYICNNIFPNNALDFDECPLKSKFFNSYYMNIISSNIDNYLI